MTENDDLIHDLPLVTEADRQHELDAACWCFPVLDEPYLRHRMESPI